MTLRSTFTLATGNTFVYFIQPVCSDACVAAIFLGSLLTRRPLVARLTPDFYPMNKEMAARPGIQRLLRRLTFMWGLVIVVKGSVTLWLRVGCLTLESAGQQLHQTLLAPPTCHRAVSGRRAARNHRSHKWRQRTET